MVEAERYPLNSKGNDPIVAWKKHAVTAQGRQFPETTVLSFAEGAAVRTWLSDSTGLLQDASNRDILDALYTQTRMLDCFEHMNKRCDIGDMLERTEVVSESVLLLFPLDGGFDAGVRMSRRDLIGFFDDLWYPSMDDLLIIDEGKAILLLVDHHERVGTMKLSIDRSNSLG